MTEKLEKQWKTWKMKIWKFETTTARVELIQYVRICHLYFEEDCFLKTISRWENILSNSRYRKFAQKRRSNTTSRKILSKKTNISADGCQKLLFMKNQMKGLMMVVAYHERPLKNLEDDRRLQLGQDNRTEFSLLLMGLRENSQVDRLLSWTVLVKHLGLTVQATLAKKLSEEREAYSKHCQVFCKLVNSYLFSQTALS